MLLDVADKITSLKMSDQEPEEMEDQEIIIPPKKDSKL